MGVIEDSVVGMFEGVIVGSLFDAFLDAGVAVGAILAIVVGMFEGAIIGAVLDAGVGIGAVLGAIMGVCVVEGGVLRLCEDEVADDLATVCEPILCDDFTDDFCDDVYCSFCGRCRGFLVCGGEDGLDEEIRVVGVLLLWREGDEAIAGLVEVLDFDIFD